MRNGPYQHRDEGSFQGILAAVKPLPYAEPYAAKPVLQQLLDLVIIWTRLFFGPFLLDLHVWLVAQKPTLLLRGGGGRLCQEPLSPAHSLAKGSSELPSW